MSHLRLSLLIVSLMLPAQAALSSTPPKDKISEQKAKEIALKKHPGTIHSSEFEEENGKWVYSFDIRSKDNKIHEVWVDAKTGKILKAKVESAAEEAEEGHSSGHHEEK